MEEDSAASIIAEWTVEAVGLAKETLQSHGVALAGIDRNFRSRLCTEGLLSCWKFITTTKIGENQGFKYVPQRFPEFEVDTILLFLFIGPHTEVSSIHALKNWLDKCSCDRSNLFIDKCHDNLLSQRTKKNHFNAVIDLIASNFALFALPELKRLPHMIRKPSCGKHE